MFFEEIQDKPNLVFVAIITTLARVFRVELSKSVIIDEDIIDCPFFTLSCWTVIDDIQMMHPSIALETSPSLELFVVLKMQFVYP